MDVLDIERDTRYLLEDLARAQSDIIGRLEEFESRIKAINQSASQLLAVAGYRKYAEVYYIDLNRYEILDISGQDVSVYDDVWDLAPDLEHGVRGRVLKVFYDLPANQKEATIYRKE